MAPITILVGENSSGKSSFLALLRIAWDLATSRGEARFNEPPFNLGAFNELAHYHGGRGKRASEFRLGLERQIGRNEELAVTGVFQNAAGQPELRNLSVTSRSGRIAARLADGQVELQVGARGEGPWYRPEVRLESEQLSLSSLYFAANFLAHRNNLGTEREAVQDTMAREWNEWRAILQGVLMRRAGGRKDPWWRRPIAMAPTRTQPRRTYDPQRELYDPEGEHIPSLLAKLAATDADAFTALAAKLNAIGGTSGLFKHLSVKRYGRTGSGPFQVQAKLEGQHFVGTLVDVGYGVSQVLPVLVECLTAEEPSVFLMQQPEVHLHPHAQAELGTFLAAMTAESGHHFVLETHSDYLVDRVRLAVRRRTLAEDDVRLLYFERDGSSVRIHPIAVDGQGDLTDAPSGYRAFFLREELDLLGVPEFEG